MTTEKMAGSIVTDTGGAIGSGTQGLPADKLAEEAVSTAPGRKKARFEDLVYGEPVYWMTVIGSFVAVIGGLVAFLTSNNFVDTGQWISYVWDGLAKEDIWVSTGNAEPNGHWYLSHLTTGDGLQVVGLVIALLSLNVGLIASAVVMFRKKETVFATFAIISAAIITIAMFVTIEH